MENNMWLDRTLLVGPNLALATSQKEVERLAKDMDVLPPEEWCPSSWDACTHTWRLGSQLICVVCLNMERAKEMEPINVAALLVHEATHVWQATREKIGGQICDETEAYAMQNICNQLFTAYRKKILGSASSNGY